MADPITRKDRIDPTKLGDGMRIGDEYDGQAKRELGVGKDREVVVTIYRRRNDTHFARILLRSVVKPTRIDQIDVDLDRYISEGDFLKAVAIAGGAIAENLNEKCRDNFDAGYIASQAALAAKEMMHDIEAEKG